MATKKYLDGDGVAQVWQATKDYVATHADSRHSAAAESLLGTPDTAQWATRESTGSGEATVRSVQGAAEVIDGELVPVQIAGIRSTGRNLIDLKSPYGNGAYNQEMGYQIIAETPRATPSGENPCVITVHEAWNSVTFVSAPLEVGKSYKFVLTSATDALRATIYMLDSNHVVTRRIGNYLAATSIKSSQTVAEGETYFAIYCTSNVATTLTLTDVMLQVSTADFSTYEPYRIIDGVEWTAQTLRAAGSVADVLYSDHVDVRVGVVDLGTLTWSATTTSMTDKYRMVTTDLANVILRPSTQTEICALSCVPYVAATNGDTYEATDKTIAIVRSSGSLVVYDSEYDTQDSAAAFKAAMQGVLLFYVLATPTTTPISPALPMSYRIEQGGTESIIVPAGEVSAAPILTVAEGESAAELVMDALACIAAPDGPTATANHAQNTYLTMGGKLYKVTSAIAVGETITAGTNVSQTTVMAELIARTA